MMKKTLVLAAFYFIFYDLFGQVSFRAGYQYGQVRLKKTNEIIDRHNDSRPWLTTPMGNIQGWHGMYYGTGFDFGRKHFEISWSQLQNKTFAEGPDPASGKNIRRDLNLKYNSFGFATKLDVSERFALGGTLDFNKFKFKTTLGDKPEKTLMNDFQVSHRLSFIYSYPIGKYFLLGVEPYLWLNYARPQIYALERELDAANASKYQASDFRERISHFGILTYLKFNLLRKNKYPNPPEEPKKKDNGIRTHFPLETERF